MKVKRLISDTITQDLKKKMVLLSGPRQVGKTSLALSIGSDKGYLNWDIPEHRERILEGKLPPIKELLILDEIHKYPEWRSLLKGLSDSTTNKRSVLVTGSARLNYYNYGGDSLQGRYFAHRLHPFTGEELNLTSSKDWQSLLTFSGFPEPFTEGKEIYFQRWFRSYRTRLMEEEIRSLENIQETVKMEKLIMALPQRVGSPLSINSLREDLNVSHQTVDRWLHVLENLYLVYHISPYGLPSLRALKKEQKMYFWIWSAAKDNSKKFENLVAGHFLKWIHSREDYYGEDWELRYFKDTSGREIDFILLKDGESFLALECKWSQTEISPVLTYFKQRSPNTRIAQVHFLGKKDYETMEGIRITSFATFWKEWTAEFPHIS
jgi:uncharacterized protein